MSDTSILIVEDEPEIAELIRFHLDREGYRTRIVHSGKAAMSAVESSQPDIIMLDLMLPDIDGLEVCRRLKWKDATRDIPILMVSAKGEEADIVSGLELGADDYVTKPFSPKVLMARVRNILRRAGGAPAATNGMAAKGNSGSRRRLEICGGSVSIDLDRHVVLVSGRPAELTVTEFGILEYLASRPGFVRTRDQIIAAVHGDGTVLSGRTVDVHVTALRRKLGELGLIIQTVRGVGYRLTEPATVPEE